MTCDEYFVLISGHLDQTNSETEHELLMEHLKHCEACRSLLTAFEEIDSGIRNLEVEPPSDLCDGVMARIADGKKQKRRKSVVRFGLAAAALFLLALGIGTMEIPAGLRQDTVSPVTARMIPAEHVYDTPEYDSETGFFHQDPSKRVPPQEIAEQRGAGVVVTYELLPEMEVCACEALADGSLLYVLQTKDGAVQLSRKYGLELFEPENGAVSDVSYALLTYKA